MNRQLTTERVSATSKVSVTWGASMLHKNLAPKN